MKLLASCLGIFVYLGGVGAGIEHTNNLLNSDNDLGYNTGLLTAGLTLAYTVGVPYLLINTLSKDRIR